MQEVTQASLRTRPPHTGALALLGFLFAQAELFHLHLQAFTADFE